MPIPPHYFGLPLVFLTLQMQKGELQSLETKAFHLIGFFLKGQPVCFLEVEGLRVSEVDLF